MAKKKQNAVVDETQSANQADEVESTDEQPTELRTDFSHYGHRAPQAEVLYARFHKAILQAGYKGAGALHILHKHFDEYMKDTQQFCDMLAKRELEAAGNAIGEAKFGE